MKQTTPLLVATVLVLGASLLSGCGIDPSAEVFDRDVLHTIELTVEDADLEQLATDLEGRVPCDVRYDGTLVKNARVRQKGNTAVALSAKPSFSVWLDSPLHGLDKLILNSSVQDPTFLHEMIGSDAYQAAGIPAARTAHASLRFNGVDHGLYVVTEAMDPTFLSRWFGVGHQNGNLYEGPCCGDFVGHIDRLTLDREEEDHRSRNDLEALSDVLLNATDAALATAVEARLDLARFITSFAMEALLNHWDGYAYRANNFYLYNNPVDGRFVFLPHGMDRILEEPTFNVETAPITRLPLRIRAIPSLDQRFTAALAQVVSVSWDEPRVLAAVDRAADVIHTMDRSGRSANDMATFDANVGVLRNAVHLRRALLDPSIRCGDGKVEGLETCDDGQQANGDGCSAHCRIEP